MYQYVLEDTTGTWSLADLRSYQDWNLRYQLTSVPGVSEVASVGGFEQVYERLDAKMTDAFHAVFDMRDRHKDENIHMRIAAYLVSIQRVAEAMKLRGWV